MCASGQTGRPPNWLQFEANDIWMHSTIWALNLIRLFKYTGPTLPAVEWVGHVEKDVGIVLSDVVGNLLHHCNHRQPWNCRRYREYRIETETDDLGLPEGVGQVIDICLQFGDNILTDIKLHQLASIHSLSGLYEKLHLLLFEAPEPFGSQVL